MLKSAILAGAFLLFLQIHGFSQEITQLSVPAEFSYQFQLPGSQNNLLRPGRIVADSHTDEIYIADCGNNRIVIFSGQGVYKYQFSVSEYCGLPQDFAVDPSGRIYVLGSTQRGREIHIFDYDGTYLDKMEYSQKSGIDSRRLESIATDDNGNIWALDAFEKQIICITVEGEVCNRFPVVEDLSGERGNELVFGSISVVGNVICLPVASLGTVYLYDLSGKFIKAIGYRGNNMGELNFPVSATMTDNQIILVLDKHRFAVVCYNFDGKFLGEFGGKGSSLGWFYHPAWLAVDDAGTIFIGQVFLNRVQACHLPLFVTNRNAEFNNKDSSNSQLELTSKNNSTYTLDGGKLQ
ncbi:MAG: NHL repeat-containing protein [Candidatus Zixiibacteriota bacterium]